MVTLSANSIAKSPITGSETLNNETRKAYLRQLCTPATTDNNKDKPTEHSSEPTLSLVTAHTTCTYAYAESDGKSLTWTGFAKF